MFGLRRIWGLPAALLLVLVLVLGLGCRKELPELFDRNQAPETYITSAPVESLFDGFKVHVSWYGRDPDGEIAYYLWAWTDSSRAYYAAWNPETRSGDRILREGDFEATHLTTRTDSVFFLLANDEGGTSRDLTFNITAVDDKGRRDPVPARHYFTASVDHRPEIDWTLRPPDTLSVGEGFNVEFTGKNPNGQLLGYQWSWGEVPTWFPQNRGSDPFWTYQISCEGPQDNWNIDTEVAMEDLRLAWFLAPDVVICELPNVSSIELSFDNVPAGPDSAFWRGFYQFGTFLVKAKCVDLAGVESEVNTTPGKLKGVVTPILNRDPDTRLRSHGGNDFPMTVDYRPFGSEQTVTLTPEVMAVEDPDLGPGYHYVVADTIPWGEDTWVTLNLQGWDLDNPTVVPSDEIETRFQISYNWQTQNLGNLDISINAGSQGRFPGSNSEEAIGFPEILDDVLVDHWGAAGQHYRMNVLPVDYVVKGYALDHFKRVDGTPLSVRFISGFPSSVDAIYMSSKNATQSVEVLNRANPVTVELVPLAGTVPPVLQFTAPAPGADNAQIFPFSYDPLDSTVVYDLQFEVHGHDDERNGINTQLGRFRWDLADADYANSTQQFSNNTIWIEEGVFIKTWGRIVAIEEEPGVDGVYRVNIRIQDHLGDVIAADETPVYLGDKILQTRFCNTVLSDAFEEFIEGESQRRFQLVNVGRVSPERDVAFTIKFQGAP